MSLSHYEARAAGIRYIVKPVDRAFRVYDVKLGSFPYAREGLGVIVQDVTEQEAQAEADRLNALQS